MSQPWATLHEHELRLRMHEYPSYSDQRPVMWIWSAQVFREDSREVYGEGNHVEPLRAIEAAVESWKVMKVRAAERAAVQP